MRTLFVVGGATLVLSTAACSVEDTGFQATIDAPPQIDGSGGMRLVLDPADELSVPEGSNAALRVALSAPPDVPLTVDLSTVDTELTITPERLTFDTETFDEPQTVQVDAASDADTLPGSGSITITADGVPSIDLPVVIVDDDLMRIIATPGAVSIGEAGSSPITITLSAAPTGDLVVTAISNDDGAASVSPGSFTFDSTNWQTGHEFGIAGVPDADVAHEMTSVTFDATDVDPLTVDVAVQDDDVQGIAVTPGDLTVTEGGTAQPLSVTLNQQPSGTVTVNAQVVGTGITIDTTQLDFDAMTWNEPKTILVTPVHDDDLTPETPIVRLSSTSPALMRDVAVTVNDDDTQVILVAAANPFTIDEGQTRTFTARLQHQPAGTVTVNVASTDPGAATVDMGSLDFTSTTWQTPQTVTVTGVQDVDLADESPTIRLTSSGATTVDLPATILDEDEQTLIVSSAMVSVPEGSTATFTVRLGYQPAADVPVDVTSPSTSVTVTGNASMTFTSGTYNSPKTVTLSAPTDSNTQGEIVDLTVASPAVTMPTTVRATVADATQVILIGWPDDFVGNSATIDGATAYAYRVTVDNAPVMLDKLALLADAAGGSFKMAVYANNGSVPGARIVGFDTAASIVGGYNEQDLTTDLELAVGTYWIVLRVDPSASIGVSTATNYTLCSRTIAFGTAWPSTFGSAICSTTQAPNIYMVTYR